MYVVRCADGTLTPATPATSRTASTCTTRSKGAKYTRSRLPVRLLFERGFATKHAAMSAESAKRLTREQKLAVIEEGRTARFSPTSHDAVSLGGFRGGLSPLGWFLGGSGALGLYCALSSYAKCVEEDSRGEPVFEESRRMLQARRRTTRMPPRAVRRTPGAIEGLPPGRLVSKVEPATPLPSCSRVVHPPGVRVARSMPVRSCIGFFTFEGGCAAMDKAQPDRRNGEASRCAVGPGSRSGEAGRAHARRRGGRGVFGGGGRRGGVRVPGGQAIRIYDALYDSDAITHVLARHEQGAVHMADGYARATGRPGVVVVTSGPGAANTVTGIATAYMDSVPLVVITAQVPRAVIGTDSFQESDIFGITMPWSSIRFCCSPSPI